jgi:hypothetical protein
MALEMMIETTLEMTLEEQTILKMTVIFEAATVPWLRPTDQLSAFSDCQTVSAVVAPLALHH